MNDLRHTVTSNLFLRADASGGEALGTSQTPPAPNSVPLEERSLGGCSAGVRDGEPWPFAALGALGGALLLVRHRRRRRHSDS